MEATDSSDGAVSGFVRDAWAEIERLEAERASLASKTPAEPPDLLAKTVARCLQSQ